MKYELKLKDGRTEIMELSDIQVERIYQQLHQGNSVPLFATTFQKKKYGDCKVGDIINIKIEHNV